MNVRGVLRPRANGAYGRAAVTSVDQLVSSLTNFGATLAAARLLGPEGLGIVALGIAIAYGVVAFTRGVIGESVLVFQRDDVGDGALTASIAVGILGTAVCVAVGVAGGERVLEPLLVLGLVLPLLTFQDTSRYLFFRDRRPGMALLSDSLWAAGQGGALIVVASESQPTATGVMMTWVAGITLAAAFGLVVLRPALTVAGARDWLRVSRRLSAWVAGQSIVAQAGQQVTFVVVGLFVSLRVLGVVRAAQTLLSPVVLFLTVFRVIGLSELGSREHQRRSIKRAAVWISAAAVALALPWAAVLVLERGKIVSGLFGPSFTQYQDMAIPVALAVVAFAVAVGAEVGNRALAAGRNVFVSQLVATLVGVPLMIGLAVAGGPVAAVWAIVGQRAIWAATAWATFLRTAATAATAPVDEPVPGPPPVVR
jgi:O-antigen/teichoic acid export membrane protein